MSARSVRTYARRFGGAAPCTVVEIRTDHLETHRLQAPSRIRARDAAHILALQTGQSVETLALPSLTVRSSAAPTELRRHAEDTYPSLRGAVSAWWSRTDPTERTELLAHGTGEVARFITALRRRGLIASYRHLVDGAPPRLLAPVGTLGYLRQLGHALPGALLLNTHFFVYDPRELDSPLAAIGDPVGMLASRGQIQRPPILPRATLLLARGGWQIQHVGAADLAIDLPDGTTLRPGTGTDADTDTDASSARGPDAGAANAAARPSLRYRGDATAAGSAGTSDAACAVYLQGRHVSLVRSGSVIPAPHGGLVLAFATRPPEALLEALVARPAVRYRVPRIPDLCTALQVGPQLVRGGAIVIGAASFRDERFQTLGSSDPTAPLAFPADADRTRAGRVGIGVTRENALVIVAVQGTSSLSDRGPDAPEGCTMTELAELLVEAGAVDALNCDGGGSTQVFAGPGALLGSTDARAVPGAMFDRPVPVAAAVQG